ncbi:1-aminocyclopropane-1-carboxylate synthase-like protein 1 [Mercenaria mercenaria]|uniref:1-aminocyclopropane-1-carboxylate synthase-like protein 1 n=1 Tax=Mercenaria mercenaria TaxID=6596 RepID=UPI00234F050E|nr:1-aminocyclopropane-1-carboxylate synthase-like protein 1 [Mercenaria mercenaria]XP_053385423.1 1-aminocyclopropane-1-carboxylate synthase-like protein 1 [Mercenaria mercenaria]
MAEKTETEEGNEIQKQLSGSDKEKQLSDNDGASSSHHTSGKSDNLEDLFATLKQQISSSDWLEKNTSEKWVKDNPELAKQYMEAANKS